MKFESKKETVQYINKLLENLIDIDYYRLKFILERNDILINDILFCESINKQELSLVSIKLDGDSVDLVLNSSSWNKHLPSIYQNNEFLKRFLFGIQVTNLSYQNYIDNSYQLFEPEKTDFTNWLSSWFGVKYNNIVDDEAKKAMLYHIIELYKYRGTKKYFIRLIKILTDVDISIQEYKIYGDYQHRDSKILKNSFKIIIKNKISDDAKEEKEKLRIIKEIVDNEKPINTQAKIEYPFLEISMDKSFEHSSSSIIDYHDQYQNDINNTYDY